MLVKVNNYYHKTDTTKFDDNQRRIIYTLKGSHNLDTSFADNLDWSVVRMTSHNIQGGLSKSSGTYFDSSDIYDNRQTKFNAQLDKKFVVKNVKNSLAYGFNYVKSNIYQENRKYTGTDVNNLQYSGSDSYFPRSDRQEFSIFVKDSLQYKDLPVALNLALKYNLLKENSYKSDDKTFKLSGNGTDPIAYTEKTKNMSTLDYSVGLSYRLNPKNIFSVSLDQATRTPSYNQYSPSSYFHWNAKEYPDVKPEISRGVTLSWKFNSNYYTQGLDLSYVNVINKYYVELDENKSAGLNNYPNPVTVKSLEYYGLLNLGAFHNALKGLTLKGTLAWAEGWDSKENSPLSTISPTNGKLTLAYENSFMNAFIRGNFEMAKAVDKIGIYNMSDKKSLATPGWATMDVGVGYRYNDSLNINFAINNVFNKSYQRWENVLYAIPTMTNALWEPERGYALDVAVKF